MYQDDIKNSKQLKNLIERYVREAVVGILEDTTLVSLVAKAADEATANQAVQLLTSKNIKARTTHPAKFGLSTTEEPGWGVFVEPNDVKNAAKILSPSIKGLEYDPFVHVS